jgi:hypothetical protein
MDQCYNCIRVLPKTNVVEDIHFPTKMYEYGQYDWCQVPQWFCNTVCHKAALIWVIQEIALEEPISVVQKAVNTLLYSGLDDILSITNIIPREQDREKERESKRARENERENVRQNLRERSSERNRESEQERYTARKLERQCYEKPRVRKKDIKRRKVDNREKRTYKRNRPIVVVKKDQRRVRDYMEKTKRIFGPTNNL